MIPYLAGVTTGLFVGGLGCVVILLASAEVIDEEMKKRARETKRHNRELNAMAAALVMAGREDAEMEADTDWSGVFGIGGNL